MLIKIVGGFLIVLGTSILGFSASGVNYKRHKNLVKFITGLTAMENEISYTKKPIDEVLIKVSEVIDFKEIFLTTAKMSDEVSLKNRWKRAVLKDSKKLGFTKEDVETILLLGGELGMTDREGQIKNIKHVKKLVDVLQKDAKDEYFKQSKLLKGLGVSVGLFLVILLM